MYDLIVVKLSVESSNFSMTETRLKDWIYCWSDNVITAVTLIKRTERGREGFIVHEYLEDSHKLGLLVDVLTIASELMVSAQTNYRVYEGESSLTRKLLTATELDSSIWQEIARRPLIEQGSDANEYPVRINPNVSHNFHQEATDLITYILKNINPRKLLATNLKLLNYWRRGFDLDEFQYKDESFLDYYKVLEYFKNRGRGASAGEKILDGAESTQRDQTLIEFLNDVNDMRNNFDIAHVRIRPLPRERTGALNFAYMPGWWDYHHDLQAFARLTVLKRLGVEQLVLISDGGLLHLELES